MIELLLRGIAIGALCATAGGFLRAGHTLSMRIAGTLFAISVIAYVLNSSPMLRAALGSFGLPFTLLSLGGAGYFWLFVITLFEDRVLTPRMFGPAGILTLVGLFGLVAKAPLRNDIWVVHNLMEAALSSHALYVVYRSWRGDLVDVRRRVRGPFIGIVTIYVIVLSAVEIGESLGVEAWWYSLVGAVALACFCVTGPFILMEVKQHLFGAVAPTPNTDIEKSGSDAADRIELARIDQEMAEAKVWKDENLSIGQLAEKTGIPEHRLRRLINDHMGYRNFAAFVNRYRIDAAKAALSDPARARVTVAAIAFELGFGSLGPFNRAFKDMTGMTPTQWRRDALKTDLPNSEIPI